MRSNQMDRRPAWGQTDRRVDSFRQSLDGWDPQVVMPAVDALVASAASVGVPGCPRGAAGLEEEADGQTVVGMAPGQRNDRWDLGRQACRHAHRTPVLY